MSAPVDDPSDDKIEQLDEGPNELVNKNLEEIFDLITVFDDVNKPYRNNISFYEHAIAKCCSIICQSTADKFQSMQKILIKHLFGESDVASLLASDLYMFVIRASHSNARMAMYKIVENLTRLAPEPVNVKGVALVNRISSAGLL